MHHSPLFEKFHFTLDRHPNNQPRRSQPAQESCRRGIPHVLSKPRKERGIDNTRTYHTNPQLLFSQMYVVFVLLPSSRCVSSALIFHFYFSRTFLELSLIFPPRLFLIAGRPCRSPVKGQQDQQSLPHFHYCNRRSPVFPESFTKGTAR